MDHTPDCRASTPTSNQKTAILLCGSSALTACHAVMQHEMGIRQEVGESKSRGDFRKYLPPLRRGLPMGSGVKSNPDAAPRRAFSASMLLRAWPAPQGSYVATLCPSSCSCRIYEYGRINTDNSTATAKSRAARDIMKPQASL